MKNYICINGNKTELTEEQLKELGFSLNPTLTAFMGILRSGKANEHYKVRDVIQVGDCEFKIIGFDHDKDVNNITAPTVTVMATRLLSCRRMHSGSCERGWIDTELRKWLNSEVYNTLSPELTQYICSVKKITHNYKGDVYETVDKLFIPAESELFGTAIWSGYEDGGRYEVFATRKDRILVDKSGNADWYWTRSFVGGLPSSAANVHSHGSALCLSASLTGVRAPLCFTLA